MWVTGCLLPVATSAWAGTRGLAWLLPDPGPGRMSPLGNGPRFLLYFPRQARPHHWDSRAQPVASDGFRGTSFLGGQALPAHTCVPPGMCKHVCIYMHVQAPCLESMLRSVQVSVAVRHLIPHDALASLCLHVLCLHVCLCRAVQVSIWGGTFSDVHGS